MHPPGTRLNGGTQAVARRRVEDLETEIRRHRHALERVLDSDERNRHYRAVDNLEREIERLSNGAADIIDLDERRHRDRPSAARQLTLMPFEAIRPDPSPNAIIKGMIPRNGLITVWGQPKCGKSFLTFDLSMHVALGWRYRGHKVQQGAVVG